MLKSITNFRLPRVSPPTNWIDESSDEDSNPLVTEEPVDPFFERLLPSSIEPPLFYVLPENRTPKDKLMVFLYLSALAVLLFAGLFTFGTQNPGHVAKAIYDSIIDRAGLISILVALSIVISAIWLYTLANFAQSIVVILILFVPTALTLLSIGTLVSTLVAPQSRDLPEFKYIAGLSGFGILLGLVSGYIAWMKRGLAQVWTKIIKLSCDILFMNPSLFVMALVFTVIHVAFSAFWMWLVSLFFLHDDSDKSLLVVFYFVLMYFWTSSIFQNLEKTVVSSVVGEWYFMRFETGTPGDRTFSHFAHVLRSSFGSVCFASLILGAVRSVQFIIRNLRKRLGKNGILGFIGICFDFFTKLTETFTSYTMIHVGLTGESFTSSAFNCSRLFRRNMILGLMTHGLSRLLNILGRILLSISVGTIVFWTNVASPRPDDPMGYEWVLASISSAVPYYVIGVMTLVIENT